MDGARTERDMLCRLIDGCKHRISVSIQSAHAFVVTNDFARAKAGLAKASRELDRAEAYQQSLVEKAKAVLAAEAGEGGEPV